MSIERALWTLGPALLLFMLVGHLSSEAAAALLAIEIVDMQVGGAEHANYVRDLVGIRARAE